jgi:hypothetical protein
VKKKSTLKLAKGEKLVKGPGGKMGIWRSLNGNPVFLPDGEDPKKVIAADIMKAKGLTKEAKDQKSDLSLKNYKPANMRRTSRGLRTDMVTTSGEYRGHIVNTGDGKKYLSYDKDGKNIGIHASRMDAAHAVHKNATGNMKKARRARMGKRQSTAEIRKDIMESGVTDPVLRDFLLLEADPMPNSACRTCRHWGGGDTCRAFPDGIPADIAEGRNDHTDPYPGDGGMLYAPKDDEAMDDSIEMDD